MALILPFEGGIPFYDFSTTIAGREYIFDVRWNGRDEAWYFDVKEIDNTPIASGVKVVLGTLLARYTNHPLFRNGVMVVIDLNDNGEGEARDATLDDLGSRVVVMWLSLDEALSLRVTATFPDEVEIAKAKGV